MANTITQNQLWKWVVVLVVIAAITGTSRFEWMRLRLSPTYTGMFTQTAQTAAEAGDESLALWIDPQVVLPRQRLERDLSGVEELLRQQPTAVELLLQKARILIQLRRNEEAAAVLKQVEMLDPNTPQVREVVDQLTLLF